MTAAGVIMGAGHLGMHYMGMAGDGALPPVYDLPGVLVALIAAALSGSGHHHRLWRAHEGQHVAGNAGFRGSVVVTVHFIAMWGTGFPPLEDAQATARRISNETLAMGVTLAAFVISGSLSSDRRVVPGACAAIPDGPDPARSLRQNPRPSPSPATQPPDIATRAV